MPALRNMPPESGPIRVVHVVLSLAIGGLEAIVVSLAGRASKKFQPSVICLESFGPFASKLADSGVPVECLGTPDTPVMHSVLNLRRRLSELDPDVLHTHNEKAHIHGALATLGRKRPALIHTRHGRWQVPTRMARIAGRVAIHRSRFIVCVSADASEVARAEGARPERLRVIRNAIDVSAYDASNYEGRSRGAHAVTVARLAPVKDLGTLLRAARLVRDARSDFRLDVVGDGPSRGDLESLSQELGLEDVVVFHGASNDPRLFLSAATFFVQSSISEGISVTLLEAMAAGLPIVATNVGGNAEVVDVRQTGLLVAPQDPRALAEAMLRVLGSPSMARAMSQSARTRVEQEFDLTRMVGNYEALYQEAATTCSA